MKDNEEYEIFDENSQVAKRKKNEFLGLKKRNVPDKKNIKTLKEMDQEVIKLKR